MRDKKSLICVALWFWGNTFYTGHVYAQSTDARLEKQKTEVISVRGQKPLGFYREEMVALKFEFFDMLNAFNTKPEFDIKCEKKSSIETRVKTMVCEPQYAIDMRGKLNQQKSQASQFTGAAKTQTSDRDLNRHLKEWHEKADQEKLRLMASNPKLAKQFLKLVKSEENFKSLHVATYGSMSNYYKDQEEPQGSSNP